MKRFGRYQLRTPDVAAARTFYAALLGRPVEDVVPLPPVAAARNVPAHWLGSIVVPDVESSAGRFVAAGGVRLGPTSGTEHGGHVAVLRDPGGAVVAFTDRETDPAESVPKVIWNQLNADDVDRTAAAYCELLGWQLGRRRDLGALGNHLEFAWEPGGTAVGSMVDIRASTGVHAHWLFHFVVDDPDPALDLVRRANGLVVGPTALPGGGRGAMCEDPHRAAFVLRERRSLPNQAR
jgi:uncharacterized protein